MSENRNCNRNRGRIVYRIVSIFKEKVAKSRLKKNDFKLKAAIISDERRREDFHGFGERSVGRLYSFDQTFVNERSKRVTSDWLVQGGKHTPGIKILGDVKA